MVTKELSAHLDKRDALRRRAMVQAEKVSAELQTSYGADHSAAFLGKVLYDQDEQYGLGAVLCLEWTLDNFMAHAFEKAYPLLLEIHEFLVKNEHGERNKREYFNDRKAFFVCKDRPICVLGSRHRDTPRYLWIDDLKKLGDWTTHRSYVRKIWLRTKMDCIGGVAEPVLHHYRENNFDMSYRDVPFRIYGDARDQGHVLTYEKMFDQARCDKVIWDVNAPLQFLFEVNTLHTQLFERELK